jgi:hypothetical protein
MMTSQHIIDKVLNACYRLNAEAYEKQALASGKKLKHFAPCEKALQLLLVLNEDKHFGQAHVDAAYRECACHPGLTEAQLTAYEYDPTFKIAHYKGDYKTLYPRLYPIKREA